MLYPSSMIFINKQFKLSDKQWVCSGCGLVN